MTKCYHCGREVDQIYKCEKCNQHYCYLHKNPVDHECNIVQETMRYHQSSPPISYSNQHNFQQSYPIESNTPDQQFQGTTDGSFTWYRRESSIPQNAFEVGSGIEFKGILLPYKSELFHILIGVLLIYIIGLINFYNPQTQIQLNELGYGWIIFMLAGIYSTAFLFHELGHRQVAVHFGLQTKFRLLTYGMTITIFGLILGIISLISQTPTLPTLALPGAVVVLGLDKIDRKTGLCKAAGPTINLIYGTLLLFLSLIIPIFPINYFLGISSSLNFMLGLFNLIPIGILDGQNIFKWNKKVYLVLVISMLILIIFNYILIYTPPENNFYYQFF